MIYIPGNVPSSKNNKQWTGKRLIDNKTTRRYKNDVVWYYKAYKKDFFKLVEGKELPYKVCFKFIRDTRRRFDYHNAVQVVADMMTEYGWIEDDNADNIIPVFEPYEYKKGDGGVYIWIKED